MFVSLRFPLLLACLYFSCGNTGGSNNVHRRFEYKHSFKGPQLVQKDKSIPFWTYTGDAIASSDWVRVAPSLKSQKGIMYNKYIKQRDIDNWEVEMAFKVMGQGRIGADGLALWFTEEHLALGPVFGAKDQWKGLGIFFDTFDNDAQSNNPYISVMVNDGTKLYDHHSDGFSQQLGGCYRDFRNKPFPVRVKVIYNNKSLTILVHNGLQMQAVDASYELCMRIEHVELPAEGYFGVSAATGGLADDHDVLSFITHSLKTEEQRQMEISEEVRKKYDTEFTEYEKKFQDAKDEYQKEHPDVAKQQEENNWGQQFESENTRELRMIFDGQQGIMQNVQNAARGINEIVGMQERILSTISRLPQGNQAPPPGGHQGNIGDDSQALLGNILRQQQDALQLLRDVSAKAEESLRVVRSAKSPGAGGMDSQLAFHEVKDVVNEVHRNVQQLMQRPLAQAPPPCPVVESVACVTLPYFLILVTTQMVILIGFSVYQKRQEAAAKKFY